MIYISVVFILYNTLGDGNDVIYGFGRNDTLQITGAKYSTVKSGNDLILTVGTGKISVVGGANTAFTIDGTLKSADTLPTGWKYGNTAKTNLTATVTSPANVDLTQTYGESVVTVNGAKATKSISITGNAKANSIKGGTGADTINGGAGNDIIYGGSGNDKIYGEVGNDKLYGDAGNDTLYGGSGNDTLTSGAGNDIFVYENGNDYIMDYTAGQDKIKLTNATITSASLSGSNVILKTSNGNITIQNGKNKKITIIDSSGKTTTQTYSSNVQSNTQWFVADDDNFISNTNNNLDSVNDVFNDNYSVAKIDTVDSNKILDENNSDLIFYSDK